MTKKNCLCAIICILMCFTLISCSSDSIDSKNIVGTMGLGNGDMIFDTSTIQGATEYADLIIIGTISEIEDINFDEVIDLTDLTELSLVLLGDKTLESKSMGYAAADVDENGELNVADLALFKQYIMGEDVNLGTN